MVLNACFYVTLQTAWGGFKNSLANNLTRYLWGGYALKRWLFLSVLLLLLVTIGSTVDARSHRFLNLEIDARVGADGLVRVTEIHTVQFDGTFSGMFQFFDTHSGVEVRDVVVSEGGISYTRLDTDSPGPAGTYFVREREDEVYVDWSFEATDEIRHFELSYVLHNVILKHEDVAEFYYQFVGDRWDQGRDRVKIVLSLPYGAQMNEVAAWGHGPLHGVVTIESPSSIVWEVENLPARTFVEGRVVFPNSLVPLGDRYTGEARLQAIFDEERGIEQKKEESRLQAQARAERARRLRALDPRVALVASALLVLFILFIWNTYGKPEPGYAERYYKELPANYPPAELAILYRQNVDGRDFTATLVDLARRGYLSIEEAPRARKGPHDDPSYKFIKKDVNVEQWQTLRPYERRAMELLFGSLGRNEVTLEDFEEYTKKNLAAFTASWKKWDQEVKESAKVHQFFDPSAKKVLWLLLPILLLFGAGFIALGSSLLVTGAVILVLSFVAVIFVVVAATRRSSKGHQEYTKWRAFRRYLKESSRVDTARVGSLGIWEEYLPYAITLGVADQMLKQLELRFPNLVQDDYHFASNWFVYYHVLGFGRISHMTNAVGKSISSATMPQGSGGTGGGFSGGGGGGFGGGGGGVR